MNKLTKIQNLKNTKGFTLVEVLVASVILFSAIAVVSMIFRGAFIGSEKADNHINLSAVMPAVLASIKDEIQLQGNTSDTKLNGQAQAWDVSYHWQASLLKVKPAQPEFDIDTRSMTNPPDRFKLWQVSLELERNGIIKNYKFNELSWTDNAK